MKRYFPSFLIILFFSVFSLEAENVQPFVMPSARASGFGGIHAAQGDDFSSIFSNPAAFAGINKQFSAAELTFSIYGPVFNLLETAIDNSGDISSIAGKDNFAAGLDIGGPIALGLVSNGLGIGFFNRTVSEMEADSLTPGNIVSKAWEEILFVGGYSFRVLDHDNHRFDIGFLGKGFYRFMVAPEPAPSNFSDLISDTPPAATHFGMGIDLGVRYCYNDIITLAVVGYDVYSPVLITKYAALSDYGNGGAQSYGTVQPRLAFGVLYHLKSEFLERYVSDITLMADYRDFIDLFKKDRRNPLLNLSFGVEVAMLNILKLRVGMAELLPSGGFGIDMKFMKMDVAVRGKQLGNGIAERTVLALDVGLLFRY